MDSSMFDGLFRGLIGIGIVIGLAIAGIGWGLWCLISWLWTHLHWI